MTENDQEADGAEMGGGSPVSRLIVCLGWELREVKEVKDNYQALSMNDWEDDGKIKQRTMFGR